MRLTKTDIATSISRRDALKTVGLIASTGMTLPACSHPNTSDTQSLLVSNAADVYVAVNGNDSWSGKLASPNSEGNDGPFATVTRARDAVRKLKKETLNKNINVLIRGGVYRLDETLVFGLEDSSPDGAVITYAAYPGEKPVFSSGKAISGWKKAPTDLPSLPEQAKGQVWVAGVSRRFNTLYDHEGMLQRARSDGFIPLSDGAKDVLHYPKGRIKNWANISDVEIGVRPHHAWIVNMLPLVSVDEKKQLATTSIPATYAIKKLHFLPEVKSCWVENVLDELSAPGNWVLNTQQGKLYLWPRDGEAPKGIVAPQLTELFRVEGHIDKNGPEDIPVKNLHFRGLSFTHGHRYNVELDDAGLQHDWEMHDKASALIRFRGTERCVIAGCEFTHSGGGAIRVDLHGQNNEISGNQIAHMGGGGILLSGYGPGTKDVNKRNLVSNNHIQDVGKIYSHAAPILVWQSGDNRIANNLIHNTPYTGIIISGFIGRFFARSGGRELVRTLRQHEVTAERKELTQDEAKPYLHTTNNVIEYNEIHDVMKELGDGNAIYIRGAGAGNIIRRNYIHHLVTPMIMQAAIRTDGGQRDTLIAENLIYKCVSQGILLKLNNRCENNVVVDIIAPPRGYYLSLREGPLSGAIIKKNIFYSSSRECRFIDELPPGRGRMSEDRRGRALARAKDADTDFNLYFCAEDTSKGEAMLAKQRADNIDLHSLASNPLFVNLEKADFRLQPESPALQLGIESIDFSKAGLLNKIS